jgi:LysR family glycine cleavage system transcriptional activator
MEDLERGALKRLFDVTVPSRERYWFVCPKETAATAKVKAFKKWVKDELGRK